jgi:alpha-tubulin suppressor-like RCC1 family protein
MRRENCFHWAGIIRFVLFLLWVFVIRSDIQAQLSQVVSWGYNGYGQTNTPANLTNAVLVDGGETYTLALRQDGRLVGWGDNYYGTVTPPADLSNVVSFVCGGYFNVALRANGTVAAFGYPDFSRTNVPAGLSNVVAVAAGSSHTLALLRDGTLRSWGGPNDFAKTNIPVALSNVTAIAAGMSHNIALRSDGRVVAWGDNNYNQTDVPIGLSHVVAIAAGFFQNYALRADGSIVAWGRSSDGSNFIPISVPASATNLTQIGVGNYHALGLRSTGGILTWGYDSNLGANAPPGSLSNVVAVAGGGYHNVAIVSTNLLHLPDRLPDVGIHAGGTLHLRVAAITSSAPRYQWSRNGIPLAGATNAALQIPAMQSALAGNYSVTVSNAAGLTVSDDAEVSVFPFWIVQHPTDQVRYQGGTVTFNCDVLGEELTYQWQWNGTNLPGATQSSLTLTNLQLVQTGNYSVVVSNSQSTASSATARLVVVDVAAWGRNSEGQASLHPGLTNVVSVKGGANHSMALRRDGSVFVWGSSYNGITNVPAGLNDAVAIAAGGLHSLVLRSNGTLLAWGESNYSQTNIPSWISNVVTIAAGGYNNAAIFSDGRLYSWWGGVWGYGSVLSGVSNMVDVSCTWAHTLGLRADGRVYAWGDNLYGQTSIPAGLSNVVAVAAGGGFSLALRSDGTVTAWGYNADGQTNVPPGLSNVVAISAVGSHVLAQRADGSVAVWGGTNFNQTPPADLPGVAEIAAGSEHSLALIGNGAPHFLNGLPDRNIAAGATAYFRIAASGQAPLRCQWRCNGTNLPSATNTWFALPNLQPSQAGLYSVVVSNALGSVTSRDASLGVAPFFFTTQPTNQVRNAGSTVTMQVQADGSGPFSYQWLFNGVPMVGSTNATLVLDNAQPEQAGSYSVLVSNPYGVLTSEVMKLELPWVAMWGRYSQGTLPLPNSFTNVVALSEGSSHTLGLRPNGTVIASGTYDYGATNVPPGLVDVAAISAGGFFSVVLRSNGTVTAWGRSDLGSINVPPGLNDVISISAGGSHTLALRSNGMVMAWGYPNGGRTNIPANLTNVVAVCGGGEHSLALRGDGTVVGWGVTSIPFGLSDVVALAAGSSHSLALRADGTVAAWGGYNNYGEINVPANCTNIVAIAAGSYHSIAWRADGAVICWGDSGFGRTTPPVGLTNVAGIYGGGPASLALLGVGAPYARTPVVARTVLAGGKTFFRAEGSGARPLSVQWRLNGDNIPGATNALLVLTNVLPPQAGGYMCVFSNRYGTASTAAGVLTVLPLQIESQPQSQTQFAGGAVSFTVGAGGPGPFTYQWRFFGTNLPGATNAALSLTNLQLLQSGDYSVAVSNVWGGVVSSPAQLTVVPVVITSQPQGATNYSGTNVTFTIVAQGVGPIQYQWQRNGVDILGAINSTLLLTNVQSVQSGNYSVRLTNPYGQVTSAAVGLEVRQVVVVGGVYYNNLVTQAPRESNIVAVAAGSTHGLALRGDGSLIVWGDNNYNFGQLNMPAGLTDIAAISCGHYHNLVLRSNGTVVTWGRNDYGQTNLIYNLTNVVAIAAGANSNMALREDGTVVAWPGGSWVGNMPQGLNNVVAIAAGEYHALALRADGTFVTWGTSNYGLNSPPPGLTNVVAIAAGNDHSLVLQADGIVRAWGNNQYGQTNVLPGLSNVIAVSGGSYHSLALRANHSAVAWGYNWSGQTNIPAGLGNIAAVAGGGGHSLLLLGDGAPRLQSPILSRRTLAGERVYFHAAVSGAGPLSYQWWFNGTNLPGATNVTLVLSNVPLSFAGNYSLVVSNPFAVMTSAVATLSVPPSRILSPPQSTNTFRGNTVQFDVTSEGAGPFNYQWRFNGDNLAGATNQSLVLESLQLNQSGNYSVIVSNAYGAVTSAPAILDVGLVAAWGDDYYGQTKLLTGLQNARVISANDDESAVLNDDGTIRFWGDAIAGLKNIPSGVQPAKMIAMGSRWLLALRTNGTVAAWGTPPDSLCTNLPANLTNIVAIAASTWHGLALRANGTVAAWGYNYYQQVTPPAGLSNVVGIACGEKNSVALLADGTLVTWGRNDNGQNSVPPGLTNVVQIVAGNIHMLARLADGRVLSWGYNQYGQTNVPTTLSNAVDIAAGWQHSLAVQDDGRTLAWGYNFGGPTNVPVTVSNAVSVAGGIQHSLALLAGGKPFLHETLANRSVLAAGRVHFAMRAVGERPLRYQWTLHGTNLPGATNAILELSNVLMEQAGPYAISVSNALGGVTSEPGELVVVPARFLSHPANRTQYAGGSTTFSFTLDGFGPFSYQWQHFGTNVSGATNVSLTLTNLQFDQAGLYSVVVSNVAGSVTSSNAQLTVVPIIINTQPQSRVAIVGSSTNFSVVAIGSPLLRYQWRLNGTNLPGGTNATLSLTNVQFNQTGSYSVLITNSYGAITSQVATLTINSIAVYSASYTGIGAPSNSIEAIAISAGGYHALALRPDRTVFGWGQNSSGQITIPASATNVMVIAAGLNHSLALRTNGTVLGWGQNTYGQTTIPANLSNVVAIAAGETHSLALRANGTISGWGYTGNGQLNIPVGLSNIVAIGAGAQHSIVLKADGNVSAWGNNAYGQITVPVSATNVVAIAAGQFHNLALRANGTVIGWGQSSYNQIAVPAGLSNVVAIAAGSKDSVALRADGTALGWGYTLGHSFVFGGNSNFVSITSGNDYTLLLGGSGSPFVLDGLAERQAFTRGSFYFNATASGRRPLHYQWTHLGVPLPGATNSLLILSHVMPAQAGAYSLLVSNTIGVATSRVAILETSEVIAWGQYYNGSSNISAVTATGLTNLIALAAGEDHGVALRSNGTVAAWGNNQYSQLAVPVAVQFQTAMLAAGGNHSLALLTNGTVRAWGRNSYGQTVVPPGLSNVVALAAGREHSLALKFDGTVVGWGRNFEGQTNVPAGLGAVVGIAAAANYSLAVRADGTVAGWGNSVGTNRPADLTNVMALAAGLQHVLALRSDGRVTAWGSGAPTNVPAGLSNVVAIAAGEQHSFALRADGRVVAWGGAANVLSQTNVPANLSNVVALASGAEMGLALVGSGKPAVTLPAFHHLNAPGAQVQLQVFAVGAGLHYQWQRDGVNIAGATNRVLPLDGNAYSGVYRVVVSNAFGVTLSRASVVTAIPVFAMTAGTGLTTNGFQLRLVGLSGRNYVIFLASTNLADWIPLHTNLPVFGSLDYLDRTSTNFAQRFYRATESDLALGPLRITSLQPAANGAVQLDVAGLTGLGPVWVWASSNLLDWQPVLTNPPQIGPWRFTEGAGDSHPVRFYRVQEQR